MVRPRLVSHFCHSMTLLTDSHLEVHAVLCMHTSCPCDMICTSYGTSHFFATRSSFPSPSVRPTWFAPFFDRASAHGDARRRGASVTATLAGCTTWGLDAVDHLTSSKADAHVENTHQAISWSLRPTCRRVLAQRLMRPSRLLPHRQRHSHRRLRPQPTPRRLQTSLPQ